MKKSFLLVTAGVIAVAGLALAAYNQWGTSAQTSNENSVKLSSSEHSNSNQTSKTLDLPYEIAFHVNENLFTTKIQKNGFSQLKPVVDVSNLEVIEMEKYFTTSLMPKNVFEALPISENMIFYSGLQSNSDSDLWFYTERVDEGSDFNVRMYNVSTKEQKVLFSKKNSPNNEYAFKPFAISNDNSTVYLEAVVFDSYLNNVEVWELNLNSMKVKELKVHAFYNSTPAMSPDGKYLLYHAGSEPNNVHVTPNQLYLYNLETDEESRIVSDEKGYVGMIGWIKAK